MFVPIWYMQWRSHAMTTILIFDMVDTWEVEHEDNMEGQGEK